MSKKPRSIKAGRITLADYAANALTEKRHDPFPTRNAAWRMDDEEVRRRLNEIEQEGGDME